jgi:hypothetical protein
LPLDETKQKSISRKFATFAARAVFASPILLLFTQKTVFLKNLFYYTGKAWELKMIILHIFLFLYDTKQKSISKFLQLWLLDCFCLCNLAAFCSKTTLFYAGVRGGW